MEFTSIQTRKRALCLNANMKSARFSSSRPLPLLPSLCLPLPSASVFSGFRKVGLPVTLKGYESIQMCDEFMAARILQRIPLAADKKAHFPTPCVGRHDGDFARKETDPPCAHEYLGPPAHFIFRDEETSRGIPTSWQGFKNCVAFMPRYNLPS